ncbi:TfuA-like protein [Glaciimonas immobilis]|uniref:TfuA-like core domain-containing protein n=1 Tax=Glaciimonas immobilis TaxID=728004 RepID=A0A840RSD5_9BURK|nr:TfuA-like protein [Glaciimonas immobilis]KAF3996844.1 hypothetical protein HAV38_16800 [Glaciimonas immobilis]MBB5199604.1 hypothetical protein [Glaciimonas immobilis]
MFPIQNKLLHIFVGPTLVGITLKEGWDDQLIVHAPARRGDVARLVRDEPPGKIALVDGTFHSYPAVGHAEIMLALKRGWSIWGLSSMGAIRAAEMHTYGMRGFGQVFISYRDHDLSDDEVTLLHQEEFPYISLSQPLIHIRLLIHDLIHLKILSPKSGEEIIMRLKKMWFGERTMTNLREYLAEAGVKEEQIADINHMFSRFEIKTHDLIDFLSLKPWLSIASS